MSPSATDGTIVLDIAPPIATITIDRASDQNRIRRVDMERLLRVIQDLNGGELSPLVKDLAKMGGGRHGGRLARLGLPPPRPAGSPARHSMCTRSSRCRPTTHCGAWRMSC